MFINTPTKGFHLSEDGVRQIEESFGNSTYMGYWCTKTKDGGWTTRPIDVFYHPNPDTSKGHTHYFGILAEYGTIYIVDASPAFSVPMYGLLTEDGEVIVSRYRHNCVVKGSHMIDGGRDYERRTIDSTVVEITVDGPNFVFNVIEPTRAAS